MVRTFQEASEYIASIPRFTKKHTLEETKEFLARIGDPSKEIPTIHIAGTNGKGSVCAYLRAVFQKKGLRTGVFTSPHLVNIRERFEMDGRMISEEAFLSCFNRVYDLSEELYLPTYFEFLFFMCMAWFQECKPDVIILETGLGGRLDATNSIASPKLCIITEIGLDHMEYLGDTVEKIAGEKAGIIKPGVPVVYVNKKGSGDVIRRKAEELESDYIGISENTIKNLTRNGKRIDFYLQSVYHKNVKFSVPTVALYQAENAALCFYGLELLSREGVFTLSDEEIAAGFEDLHWPGRMEEVAGNITLDGAHNEDGIRAFLDSVREDGAASRRLVYSAVSDKNIEKITDLLISSELFHKFYVAPLYGTRGADMERLKAAFKAAGEVSCYEGVKEAFLAMKADLSEGEQGYAAGSLYLVGKIKEML